MRGPGVFGHIVERFLRDPVERHADLCRDIDGRVHVDVDRDARAPGHGLPQLLQQIGQVRLGERGGTQLEQQRAHLGEGAAGQLTQLLKLLPALLRVTLVDPGRTSATSDAENSVWLTASWRSRARRFRSIAAADSSACA